MKATNALLSGGKAGKVSVAQTLNLEDPSALAKSRIHLKIKAVVPFMAHRPPVCQPREEFLLQFVWFIPGRRLLSSRLEEKIRGVKSLGQGVCWLGF